MNLPEHDMVSPKPASRPGRAMRWIGHFLILLALLAIPVFYWTLTHRVTKGYGELMMLVLGLPLLVPALALSSLLAYSVAGRQAAQGHRFWLLLSSFSFALSLGLVAAILGYLVYAGFHPPFR